MWHTHTKGVMTQVFVDFKRKRLFFIFMTCTFVLFHPLSWYKGSEVRRASTRVVCYNKVGVSKSLAWVWDSHCGVYEYLSIPVLSKHYFATRLVQLPIVSLRDFDRSSTDGTKGAILWTQTVRPKTEDHRLECHPLSGRKHGVGSVECEVGALLWPHAVVKWRRGTSFTKKIVKRRSQVSQEHTNTVCGGYTETQGSLGIFICSRETRLYQFSHYPVKNTKRRKGLLQTRLGSVALFRWSLLDFPLHDVVHHWLKVYQVWVHHPMSPYTSLDHQQGPTGAGIYHYHFRRIVPHAGDGKIQVVEWLSTQENQQQHFQVSRKYRVRHNTHQGCGQQDSSGKDFQLQRIQDHSLKVLKTDVKGSKCNNCDGCVIHSVVSPQ